MKNSVIAAICVALICAGALVAGSVTAIYKDQGGDRMVFGSGATIVNNIGVGTVIDSNGVTVAETGDGVTHLTTFTFSSFEVKITDSGANGAHRGTKIYDFPAGYIKADAVLSDLDITCNDDGLTATATHEFGVGTTAVAADNDALTATEEDILTGVAADLSSSEIALNTQDAVDDEFDGTTTAVDMYLNMVFAANDATASDTCSVTGTLNVVWVNAGDY
jgi:hypothetical protein